MRSINNAYKFIYNRLIVENMINEYRFECNRSIIGNITNEYIFIFYEIDA